MLTGVFEEFYKNEQKEEYLNKLLKFIKEEEELGKEIYPKKENRLKALEKTSFENTKVVILGQDPYHGEGQAQGYSFSVPNGMKLPPSLRNIYKEMETDLNLPFHENGDLTKWTEEGVLLLNAVLTVEKSNPASHAKKGWEIFTDKIIKLISEKKENVVFILWGKYAENKKDLIDQNKHKIIMSAHPSPFSARRGFFGSRCFSETNKYLKEKNIKEINWKLV